MEVFITLIIFGAITSVLLVPQWLRSRERHRIIDAFMQASERGQTFPEETIASLLSGVQTKKHALPIQVRDTRRGVLLLAVAATFLILSVGLYALMAAHHEEGALYGALAAASLGAIPGMIGAAYLLLARAGGRAEK